MGLEALLVSRDPGVPRILKTALDKMEVAVSICTDEETAAETLETRKFDAVIIDYDDLYGGLAMLQQVRKGKTNQRAVTVAILNGETNVRTVFGVGASFVLQKPLSLSNIMRCFNAAYGFMERERRRYFRMPVDLPVSLFFGQTEMKVTACNLSEGGMALQVPEDLSANGLSKVKFSLADAGLYLECRGEVAWRDSARMGIRFVELPATQRDQLEKFIFGIVGKEEADQAAKRDARARGKQV
jgi:DNA-binding response OmpR family regulator